MKKIISLPLNTQPPEKPFKASGANLDVVDVWHTIQGEGPLAGRPAIFVRLAGCNLQCPSCDTDYTTNRKMVQVGDLMDRIEKVGHPYPNTKLVVLTGGEPFRQDLKLLISGLITYGWFVQVETNGTMPYPDSLREYKFTVDSLMIVCSPKTGTIHTGLKDYITCLKYVMEADHVSLTDGLPTLALGGVSPARPWKGFQGSVILNPMDSGDPIKNKRNLKACAESCLAFGHTLGVQIHKLAGLE